MAIQKRLPLQPAGGIKVNETVSFLEDGKTTAYFAEGIPVFAHAQDDVVDGEKPCVQRPRFLVSRPRPNNPVHCLLRRPA